MLAPRAARAAPPPYNLPESLLWAELRGRRLGVYFRRQVVLAERYIADFAAPSIQLVVEVDGATWHGQRRAADARRDAKLRRIGYHVLRVDAQLVLRELSQAVALVREAVERLAE